MKYTISKTALALSLVIMTISFFLMTRIAFREIDRANFWEQQFIYNIK
jgi:hypothetical protein